MAAIDRKPTNSLVLMVKFFFTAGPRVFTYKICFAYESFICEKSACSQVQALFVHARAAARGFASTYWISARISPIFNISGFSRRYSMVNE
jgi:hypothetical protein